MSLKEEKIDGYLNSICSLVKNKRVHSEIKLEMKYHLNELEKDYERKGAVEEEATELALKDLGNPKSLGEKLNKVHKAKIDFKLIICSCILLVFGILSAYSFENSFPTDFWEPIKYFV